MRKEKTIKQVKINCDMCGQSLSETDVCGVHEGCIMAFVDINYNVWYGGRHKISEICYDCNYRLWDLLKENFECFKNNNLPGQAV